MRFALKCFIANGLLLFVTNAHAANGSADSMKLERCAAVWEVTLTLGGAPGYEGSYCESENNRQMTLVRSGDDANLPAAISSTLALDQKPIALSFTDADAPGKSLWQGKIEMAASESTLTPSDGLPSGQFSWRRTLPKHEHFYAEVINQDVLVVAKSLRERSQTKDGRLASMERVLSNAKSRERITLRFQAIPTDTLLYLTAQVGAVQFNYRADGEVVAETVRDQAKLDALKTQFYAANFDEALEKPVLDAIRALCKLKSAKDLPPDGRTELESLAKRLEREKNTRELVALREEMLAYAQRLDGRASASIVAVARAELAYAQQLAAPDGSLDLALLKASEPILLKDATVLDGWNAYRIGKALLHRQKPASAIEVLERGVRSVDLSEFGAMYEAHDATALLLATYRQQQRVEPARALLKAWRQAEGIDFGVQAFRDREQLDLRDAGRFLAAIPVVELMVMLAPPFADTPAIDLEALLSSAIRVYLASGDYARAAQVYALYNQFIAARVSNAAPSLKARRSELALLQALAAVSKQTVSTSLWTERLQGNEPLGSDKSTLDVTAQDFGVALSVMFELERLMMRWKAFDTQTAALPAGVLPADAINVAEVRAVLRYYASRDPFALERAEQQFAQTQHWRQLSGENAAEVSARATWFAAAIKAIEKLPEAQ